MHPLHGNPYSLTLISIDGWGSPGLGGIRTAGLYTLAGLLDREDTRLKTSSCVRMGLSFAWKASLAIRILSFLSCNRLHVTLALSSVYINRRGWSLEGRSQLQSYQHRLAHRVYRLWSRGRSTLVLPISSILIKQEVGFYLHREGPNLGKHLFPLLPVTISLDAQIGTPYPRSAGFDTDSGL